MKPIRTLVLIADEAQARIYERNAANQPLTQLQSLDKSQFDDTDQRYSDFPGRSAAAPGMAVHTMDRTTTEREQERDAFAVHVLDAVDRHLRKGGYRRVAIAAPPKMLGSLRARMKGNLVQMERFELDKNLMAEKPQNLAHRFSDLVII